MIDQTNSFGYWLRRRRRALDLTQGDLARRVGCATETIRKIETDMRRPSRQMAERMAVCLAPPPSDTTAARDSHVPVHGYRGEHPLVGAPPPGDASGPCPPRYYPP